MRQLLHSDYYALYLGTVDNTQNTLDATATFSMITNLKAQFATQGRKMQQVSWNFGAMLTMLGFLLHNLPTFEVKGDEHLAYAVGAQNHCVHSQS